MRLVPDELTPLTLEEAIETFARAHVRCIGIEPSAGTLACIVAQSALETGYWKSLHCNNFGNVKAGASWDGSYCMFRCNEVIDGKVQWFDPPHPQTWFRAFESPEAGALEQLKFLVLTPRYARAWHECCDGDAYHFASELGIAGYYTADREKYSQAVANVANRILAACASYLSGEGHSITEDDRGYVEALVYRTLSETNETDRCPPFPGDIEGAPETPRLS